MAIKHSKVATAADDPSAEINKAEWNADHVDEYDNPIDLHAPGSDNQDLSGLVEKVAGSSLVPDTEIAKIHVAGSDNQDLSGLVEKVAGSSLVPDTEIGKIHTAGSDNQDLSMFLTHPQIMARGLL